MNESYVINNLEQYAESIRKNAALSFSENYDEDLDLYITISQVCQMVEQNAIGIDEEDRYIIDEESYDTTFDQIRTRLYNIGLARLAASGEIECAWDSDANEMVFWIPESKSQHKASANGVANESKSNKKRNTKSKRKNT
jgi:hypothetical protein